MPDSPFSPLTEPLRLLQWYDNCPTKCKSFWKKIALLLPERNPNSFICLQHLLPHPKVPQVPQVLNPPLPLTTKPRGHPLPILPAARHLHPHPRPLPPSYTLSMSNRRPTAEEIKTPETLIHTTPSFPGSEDTIPFPRILPEDPRRSSKQVSPGPYLSHSLLPPQTSNLSPAATSSTLDSDAILQQSDPAVSSYLTRDTPLMSNKE